MARFKKGDDPVFENDFSDVIEVLKGKSRWQRFTTVNVDIAKRVSGFKDSTLKIDRGTTNSDGTNDFNMDTRALGLSGIPTDAAGVTDKVHNRIVMKEWNVTRGSYLLAVLHECVHLVSDPAGGGSNHSTAATYLDSGLLEGLVEVVAEDILCDQRIPLPTDPGLLGHTGRVPIVRELIAQSDSSLWGWLLFHGNSKIVQEFCQAYSTRRWDRIKHLATLNMTKQALQEIQELSKRPLSSLLRTCSSM